MNLIWQRASNRVVVMYVTLFAKGLALQPKLKLQLFHGVSFLHVTSYMNALSNTANQASGTTAGADHLRQSS